MLSCIDPKNEQMLESHALRNTEEKANQAINRLRNNKQNLERAMTSPKSQRKSKNKKPKIRPKYRKNHLPLQTHLQPREEIKNTPQLTNIKAVECPRCDKRGLGWGVCAPC
jgi:DNA-directed RNA polymerase subunit M/transcription elongation factor TFIIS